MKAKLLSISILLLIVAISTVSVISSISPAAAQGPYPYAAQGPYTPQYGSGDCLRSFIVGVDLQRIPEQISPEGFSVYIDGAYRGVTDKDGRLVTNAYGGQHTVNASKEAGSNMFSGSWKGIVECYYPSGGTMYLPIAIGQIPHELAAQAQPVINIPGPANIEDIVLIVVIAVALIIGIIIVLKSIRYFLINAILGLLVLYLANAFAGLNIAYTWLAILVCAIGGIAGAIIVIILHLYGIII
jgi:hypothetical protein